jgi:hypothetical protein
MQPIEKALKYVVDAIGSNYSYPIGEFIVDEFDATNNVKNPFFGQTPTPLKFAYGTRKELNIYLTTVKEKYPLMWLVYPLEELHNNNAQAFYTYPKARLIFAINTTTDKSVNTRLQTTRFVLDQIIEKLERLMRNSHLKKFIAIDKNLNISQSFEPNYSVSQQKDSGTIDVWDAIVYNCCIYLTSNCIP